jgi:Tfp pilus assembly protein PilO
MASFSWNKTPIKHKFFLFIISIVVISWAIYSFLLLPQWGEIDQLTAQYITERQQIQVIEDFLLVHPNPEQHVVELDNKLLYVNTMLPDNPEISSFLTQVEQLSRECGVQLGYIKPTKVTNKEDYREYEIEISLNGTFIQSMDFLNKFENNSRFTNVTTIAMLVEKSGLESKISAKVYSYGIPTAAINSKSTDNKK